jgi:transcriptional regulator with XRE-family HTH domain
VLPSACRAIGAQLATAREAQQLSVEAIASKLLLSRGQVLGLEHAEAAAFYSVAFFLRGLRKYMAFMGLPPDLLVEDDDGEEEGGLRLMLADVGPGRGPVAIASAQVSTLAATAAVLVVVTASALYVGQVVWGWWSGGGADTVALASPLPAAPIIEPVVASLPVQAQPAAAVLHGADPDSTVRVSVGKATWVFIRYPDNRVVERKLAAGEEMEVGPLPVFLAVGTADSVEVRVENRPVALGPYIRNGQVRMTQPDLAKLIP